MLEIRQMNETEEKEFMEGGVPTTGEFLKANISEGFDNSTLGVALDKAKELFAAGGQERASDTQAQENINAFYEKREAKIVDPESPQLKKAFSLDEYKASPWFREGVKFEDGWSENRFKFMAEGHDERKEREDVLKKGNPDGMISKRGAVGFVGQMIGGLPDPINLIPISGVVKGAGLGAKVAGAALEGAVGNLAVSAVTRPYYEDRGIDSTWQDYASDLFIGGVMGGAFGAGGHALESAKVRRETLSIKDRQVNAKAADTAIQSTLEGEPVDLSEVEGFNDNINKLYDISDRERAELIEVKRTEIETLTGLAPEEANVAAILHVSNSVVMSKHLGISPKEYLDSNYGADFQKAEINDGKIQALPQNQVELDRLIDDEIQTMLAEVSSATKEGGGKVFDDGSFTNTVADISTYPEWYGSIGAKNRDDFAGMVKNKDRAGYQKIKEIAEQRLREGYNSKQSGPMEPSADYRALSEGQAAEIPVDEMGQPLFQKAVKKKKASPLFEGKEFEDLEIQEGGRYERGDVGSGELNIPKGSLARAKKAGFDVENAWFHGSKANIEAFADSALGASTGAGSAKIAHFFASSPNTASDYARASSNKHELSFKRRLGEVDSEISSIDAKKRKTKADKEKLAELAKKRDEIVDENFDIENGRFSGGDKVTIEYENKNLENGIKILEKKIKSGELIDTAEIAKYKESLAQDLDMLENGEWVKSGSFWNVVKKDGTRFKNGSEAPNFITDPDKIAEYPYQIVATKERTQLRADRLSVRIKEMEGRDIVKDLEAAKNKLAANKQKLDGDEALDFGESVYPTVLKMENPLIVDFKDSGYREVTYREILEKAQAAGHDGVIFKNTYDPAFIGGGVEHELIDVAAVFEPKQIRSVFAEFKDLKSDNILYKKSGDKVRGAIQFAEDKRAVISLLKDTNESTILHESAHLFLKNYQRLEASGKAPQAIVDDLNLLREWAKTQKGDKSLDADTNFHEKVARGFEQYLREGKAPIRELQDIFDRMREWLTSIYKNASDLKVEISPEARRVFDRMVALEPRPDVGPVKAIDVPPVRTAEELDASISAISDEAILNHRMVSPEERAVLIEEMTALNKEEAELQTLFQGAETNLDDAGQPIDPLIDAFNKTLADQEAARIRLIEIAAQKKELKRQAYLNLDARERIFNKTKSLMAKGVDPEKAILSLLEGGSSLRGIEGAGNSLDGRINAIGETMSAKTFAKLREIDPRIEKLLMDDPEFNETVLLEMLYIGRPEAEGRKIDPMAQKVANVIAEMKEELRTRANLAGADIGKLDGHVSRFHDYEKMVGTGRKEKWIASIKDSLDLERSFKGLTGKDLEDAIDVTYENMTANEWLTREHGQFDPVKPVTSGPRNVASRMEKSRALHFKTPELELAYLKEFGQGRNALGMAVRDLQNFSRRIAIMEVFGTQPETNLASLYSTLRQELRNDLKMDPDTRNKQIESLNFQNIKGREGAIGHAFMLAMGEGSSFANPRLKYFGSMIRLFNSVSKLGAATLSQFTDFAQIKNEARLVTGNNQASAWVDTLNNYFAGVSPEVRTQVLDNIATLGDGMNYANFNRFDQDNVNNWVGRMSDKMFKWSGQNWHTSKGKSAMALLITKELGRNMDKSFNDLAPNLKAMLSQYGSMNAEKWEMLRSVGPEEIDGVKYFHPGLVSKIDDARFEALIPDEFKGSGRPEVQTGLDGAIDAKDQARLDSWEKERASHIRREKYRLETDVQTFFLEESRNGMLEPDARVRRLSTFGSKSGTGLGEAARLMMQFKSFTVAYTDRILGGARYSDQAQLNNPNAPMLISKGFWGNMAAAGAKDPSGAIQHVVASVGLAYMSMVAKDLSKGLEPKDPTLAKTWMMAGFQSGGMGIMGDFIQNAVSSRSNSDIIAAMAGPTVGLLSNIAGVGGRTLREAGKGVRPRGGEKPDYSGLAEDYVHLARSNMPFGSLWYTRAAVNYLVWDRLKESLEPGSIRRSERRLKKEYNQQSLSMETFGF